MTKTRLIRKDGVRLYEFLGESVIDVFEDVRSHPTSGSTSDRVAHNESFQRVGIISLAVDYVE